MTFEQRIQPASSVFQPVIKQKTTNQQRRTNELAASLADLTGLRSLTANITSTQFSAIAQNHSERGQAALATWRSIAAEMASAAPGPRLLQAYGEFLRDSAERSILMLDTLRERGDIFLNHQAAGCPPVLTYDYEVILDGATLPNPSNYVLLRILPPAGITVDPDKRPYVIIDPRAGHGGGIGGFKPDSQVGVALKRGNPVYFVAFKRDPEPTQTLADVTRTEAAFVREVTRLHPKSPKPVVVGNCQGGWATLMLAATNPDLTGPLLINGAPVDAWAGEIGKSPMRYKGGLRGGAMLAMLASDLGNGQFDGASLVENFEKMNPGRNAFGKYYDLYSGIDTGRERFLEFERWWGGFFFMTEAEILWIVENIFIGNKLARNEARLEHGRAVDLKAIRAPIVIFTSRGDNITPPRQALNWITGTYADADEIRIRGQRIVYLMHESVGHLGIFVSGSVAKKEHTKVASTLRTIESLPPGLYEMIIEDTIGDGHDKQFVVSFAERELSDINGIDSTKQDEAPFAAVARLSEMQAGLYDVFLRPFIKATTTEESARLTRAANPLRVKRAALSSQNAALRKIQPLAEQVTRNRHPASPENPFVKAERLWADLITQSMDLRRDIKDAWSEILFYNIYATPAMRWFGRKNNFARTLKTEAELLALPEVQLALSRVENGGFIEAVIRMLILLADSRGAVRQDRLERSARVLTEDEPFRSLDADKRARIIHEQTLIVEFAREDAIAALPALLPTAADRALAAQLMLYVPGRIADMAPDTKEMIARVRALLGQPEAMVDVTEDPLSQVKAIAGPRAEITTQPILEDQA